jgi:hypothetical protein
MPIYFSHNEHFDQAISSHYQQLIDSHLKAIREIQNRLARQQTVLDSVARLRPAECDDLHSALRLFQKAVQDFEALLHDGGSLLGEAAANRFKILVSLYYTGENIRTLLPLISRFRAVCLESSRDTYETLETIRYQLGQLLQVSRGLEPETKEMLADLDFAAMSNWPSDTDYIN